MKPKFGTVEPRLALIEVDRADLAGGSLNDRFPIARATLIENIPNACIVSVHDVENESGRIIVGIMFITTFDISTL